MLKTGMIIGERYEVVGRIGTGGMADVYKAKDHKLNRFVAVKVLKAEFREDTTFSNKFRTEAQSAAGLTHPNIVNVFDVGDDEGIYYIVMELIEGITLKEYISKKGQLSVKEATSIAIQVSMGLEEAHKHGIVHRDVKPQNIIISTDGKVKVADFGIARATSSNTISSNAMGSVHYSSPEQVRGGYSNEKSDIYSLGITLYEMVTGRVPFEGDTTVSIAIKHLQEEMVPPSEYAPELPFSLEQIIFKCTQKSIDRRYANMEEVIADLKHSLIDPDGDFVTLAPLTNEGKTQVLSDADLGEIKQSIAQGRPAAESYSRVQKAEEEDEELYDEDYDDEDEEDSKRGINRSLEKAMTIGALIIGAVILIVLIVLIGRAAGIINIGGGESSTQQEEETNTDSDMVEVPDLVGKTEDEATEIVRELGIGLKYSGEEESEQPQGTISSQEIEPGTQVELYTTINYKLSKGTQQLSIPDVVGRTESDAHQILVDMGFNVTTSKEYSYEVEAGSVISTSPEAGTQAKSGDTVNLVISRGEDQGDSVEVPDVIGMTEEEARRELAKFSNVVTEYQPNAEAAEGEVYAQSLEAYSWTSPDTTITITVNKTAEVSATPAPTDTAVQTPVTDTSGTWKCTQKLDTPTGYQGGAVRLELVQTVNGASMATTIVDGKAIEFPYQLDIVGSPGVTEGTLYLSEMVGDSYVELGHYPITFEKVE